MKIDILVKCPFIPLFLIIGFYLFWELRALDLPALQTDEAWNAIVAFRAITNSEQPSTSNSAKIFGRYIPILLEQYHGACEVYLLIPFILIGGLNIFSIRIFSISCGIIVLYLLYHFCKKFLNNAAALIITFLLAIDWNFIAGSKVGFSHGFTIDVFLIGSLLCFQEWYRKGKRIYFSIGSFLVGLGLYTKSWFLWYGVALVVIFFVSKKEIIEKFPKRELLPTFLLGLISFCLSSWPLIYHEIKTGFGVTKFATKEFVRTTGPCNNFQYILHISDRIDNFKTLPFGFFEKIFRSAKDLDGKIDRLIRKNLKGFYYYFFIMTLIWHLITIKIKRLGLFTIQKKIILILFFTMFFQTPFSPIHYSRKHLTYLHILLFLPIIKIILGMALYEWIILFRRLRVILVAILCALFLLHLFGLYRYNLVVGESGGWDWESEAIYKVASYLSSRDIKRVILMDQKLWHFIPIITRGKVGEKYFNLLERLSDPISRDKLEQNLEIEFEDKDNFYLFRSSDYALVRCFDWFEELAQKKNKRVREIERFYQRDGEVRLLLYEVY